MRFWRRVPLGIIMGGYITAVVYAFGKKSCYSLIDQIDWDIALAKKCNKVNPCGLYDLKRKPRPVAAAYRQLLEEYGQITIVPHGELFEITDRPARLKVEV